MNQNVLIQKIQLEFKKKKKCDNNWQLIFKVHLGSGLIYENKMQHTIKILIYLVVQEKKEIINYVRLDKWCHP